jgi:hypothetical protein
MGEDHPFSITVERILDIVSRFRWSIYENGKLRDLSPNSYATKREALVLNRDAWKAI